MSSAKSLDCSSCPKLHSHQCAARPIPISQQLQNLIKQIGPENKSVPLILEVLFAECFGCFSRYPRLRQMDRWHISLFALREFNEMFYGLQKPHSLSRSQLLAQWRNPRILLNRHWFQSALSPPAAISSVNVRPLRFLSIIHSTPLPHAAKQASQPALWPLQSSLTPLRLIPAVNHVFLLSFSRIQ